jgi:hypothetical protein
MPNTALLAWLQQQTGQELSELFADEKGDLPWRELRELTATVAKLAGVAAPDFLKPTEDAPDGEPAHLPLVSAPRGDNETEGGIIPAAVLGLFPMANQGLLRDMHEMMTDEALAGPIASFVRHDALLDAPPPSTATDQPAPAAKRTREFSQERLVTAADPSQSRAVRLARECQGLVIHGPPGTGKSQTITNIVGDHLWRGQRVLVVCDKRTALDVVIDRLDRLGLRKLCALVYDPQRDRRELYKNIRQQLDDLPDLKTNARAEREVDRLDTELQGLHAELTKYTSALSARDDRSGLSFHDMVGQWLTASGEDLPEINPTLLDAITLEVLQSHEQDVREVLDRALEADYPNNPWREAWGISLADYLARPMADVRAGMTSAVEVVKATDASAHPTIPPFAPKIGLEDQAKARVQLAKDLRGLLQKVDTQTLQAIGARFAGDNQTDVLDAKKKLDQADPLLKAIAQGPLDGELLAVSQRQMPTAHATSDELRVIKEYADAYRLWSGRYRFVAASAPSANPKTIVHWLSRDAQAVGRAKQRIESLQPMAKLVSAAPVDRSLWLQFQRQPFDIAQTVRWLGLLNVYLESAAKWYAFLLRGPKKEAGPLAQFFGLALSPETATRLRDFLTGLRARLELKTDLEDGILPQPLPAIPSDEDLLAAFSEHAAVIGPVASGQAMPTGTPVSEDLIAPLIPAPAAAARPVFAAFGISPDQQGADRLEGYLSGLHARLRCVELIKELSIPIAAALPDDAVIQKTIADASAILEFLIKTSAMAQLACLRDLIGKVVCDNAQAPSFLDGLDRSPARVAAILKLGQALASTMLFRAAWLDQTDQTLRRGSPEAATIQALFDHLDHLEAVLRVAKGLAALPEALRAATDVLIADSVNSNSGLAVLRKSALSAEITAKLKADPSLHEVDRQRMKSCFERYRTLDVQKRKAVRDALLHRWVTQQKTRLLSNNGSRLSAAGAEIRRRLTIQGERAMRLRQVIALGRQIEGGDPLFDLCPVWMASPETVAQLFPREPIFDVVIFDEASQCRLEEGLPVLTRAKRVVVAGDPQQLPPTRFFESAVAESEDEAIESEQQLFETRQGEIEDLLAAALNLEIQQSYLDVHYRSRNSDLIQFSNQHFYNSRLQPIPGHPSNRAKFAPITLYRAGGTYDKRTNEVEAEQVCTIVSDLLKRSDPPSIGIACFNLPQRDLIVEKLEELTLEDAGFARRLAAARSRQGSGASEGLFVKNLENVQGDERDHIIISTTYGPDRSGKFHRRFGPVGRAGGGRRLNVLITRARNEVHVVSSIPAEAYRTLPPVPAGEAPSGAWLLFAYLAYAERLAELYDADRPGTPEQTASSQPKVNLRPTRSPSEFAGALANELVTRRKIGSDVHWGNDGFCIDLALHHPERPEDVTIGILCDGTRFVLAEDPVEWDVFRTGVLQDQGWTLHRMWTPHFFRDPEGNTRTVAKEVQSFLTTEDTRDGLRVS